MKYFEFERFFVIIPKEIYIHINIYFIKQAFYYPPKAGYPVGTSDSPRTLLLELHYDNPKSIEGWHLTFCFFYPFSFLVKEKKY